MTTYIWSTEITDAYIGIPFPDSIALNKNSISLTTIWQTEQLSATIEPTVSDKTITWSSDDTTVATVSTTWLVTCVNPWSCTITATTVNGLTATCGVLQARLPSAYQEVEWICSSGSQYIDTWWYPTGNSELEFEFEYQSWSWTWSFWVDSWWTVNAFSVFTDRFLCYGTQYQSVQTYYVDGTKYKLEFKNLTWTLNWVQRFTYTQQSFTSSYSAYAFAKRRNNSIEMYAKIKIYALKLWNSWTLERDFVPCYRKLDSVIWLYDLVNDQFYTNQWSWTFTKWSDV